jgi:hypothetical protein
VGDTAEEIKARIELLRSQRDQEIQAVKARYQNDMRRLGARLAAHTRSEEKQTWQKAMLPALDYLRHSEAVIDLYPDVFKMGMGDKVIIYRERLFQVGAYYSTHAGIDSLKIYLYELERSTYRGAKPIAVLYSNNQISAAVSDVERIKEAVYEGIDEIEKKVKNGWRPQIFHGSNA